MAALEAAGEIARMERVSNTPRPTTAVETAPNADHTQYYEHGYASTKRRRIDNTLD